jgi:Rieske Fe-S protein
MSQLLLTPHGIYKYFRQLVQGYTGAGVEADGFYINKTVGTTAIKQLKYFKIGVGGPNVGGITEELTRNFFDAYIKNGNGGKGDLHEAVYIYAMGSGTGYGGDDHKKALAAGNFYLYGNSVDSKVIGVLGIEANAGGTEYWNIPGVAFQVGCHLSSGEGNWDSSGGVVTPPAVNALNEIGIYDEDDILVLYGVFPVQNKNATLTVKVNNICMLKTLDYQLVISAAPTTTSSTTSSSTTSTSSSSSTSSTSSSSSSSSSSTTP